MGDELEVLTSLESEELTGDESEDFTSVEAEECCGNYSISEFKEYLEATQWASKQNCTGGGVFWRPRGFEKLSGYKSCAAHERSIEERIKLVLEKIRAENCHSYVVQFWAPRVIEERCYLTTVGQPFAVGSLGKGLCWYRKHSMQHEYVIGNEAKQIGPPERVFRNGHSESSPDLRLYSVKEFPLRDQAERCGFR